MTITHGPEQGELAFTALPERLRIRITLRPDGCWEWVGRRDDLGYGRTSLNKRQWFAHRLVYTLLVRELPPFVPGGPQLDHLCRNRACCNPEHLELVSGRENIARGENRAARALRENTCTAGHPLEGDNLYAGALPRRVCRICLYARNAGNAEATKRAAEIVGMSRAAFIRQYGQSRAVVDAVLTTGALPAEASRVRPLRPFSAEHGTSSGYQNHIRLGEPACEPCRAARRENFRKYAPARNARRREERRRG